MKKASKKLTAAVLMGLLAAAPFCASAADQTLTEDTTLTGFQGSNVTITGKTGEESVTFEGDAAKQFSVSASDGTSEISNVKDITLTGTWGGDHSVFYTNGANAALTISAKGDITSNGDLTGSKPFHAMGGNINVTANSINIAGAGNAVFAQTNGSGAEGHITIETTGDIALSTATGVTVAAASLTEADKTSTVSLTSKEGSIALTSSEGTAVAAYGSKLSNSNKVTINAADTVTLTGKTAILVNNGLGSGEQAAGVTVKGASVKINGAVKATKNSDISISGSEQANITGDITIADHSNISITGFKQANITGNITSTDSTTYISLGQNGSLDGAVSDDNVSETGTVTDSTKGITLDLGKGSTWNVTGDSTVSTLKGTGTIALDVEEGKEGATVNGSVTVGPVDKDASLTVAAQQTADDIQSSEKALQAMAGATTGLSDGTVFKIDEGILKGGSTGILGKDNTLNSITTDDSTSTMGNMKSLASVAILSWRQEDSTFSQRLGDLRETKDGQGIWARMSRGEFEYKSEFKNQYNYFQIGYDKAFGSWHYGAAISYNDGETSYAEGYGENDSTSLSLYGTWLGDRGQYTDIVLKEGRLNNKYTNHADAGTTSADYDMWGTSISAEYGQKLDLQDGWFVTPQAQLTYMRIGSENYTAQVTTTAGTQSMQVRQDALDSFVGRIGLEAGKSFSDKGSFYAKASLLHEFAGDADTYLTLNNISNSYSQDLGDTWYEAGFGINYKLTDSSYLYADVVRTFGGDIDTPWQWNLGMRFSV